MNPQQVFDTVLTAIRKQGGPSVGSEGFCRYRGENGAKCAAGHLISDAEYDRTLETNPVTIIQHRLPAGHVIRTHTALVQAMQSAHDQAYGMYARESVDFMRDFESRMRRVAELHDLVYTEPSHA